VLLVDLPVRACDVREGDLCALDAATGLVVQRSLRVIQLLAVDRESLDLTFRAEVGAGEPPVRGPRRRAAAQRAETGAEADKDARIVIRRGRDRLAGELALRYPDAADRRTPLRRPEDGRQPVEGVDRHVVQRAAARLAEVPRRVDRRGVVLCLPLRLVEVIGA